MESPAQFSAFGAADDDSLLFDQAPPSAASSSRFMSTSSISPGGRGDEGDETADMTLRLENVGLAQDRPAQFQQQQQQSEDTFAFRGPPSSSTRPPPPGTRTDPEVYAAPARAAALEPEGAEEDASARVVRLKTERDRLRKLNESLERSITHFSGARGQLGRLQDNIQTTHGLMELWSNLMSQTEHTRHLVMDPNWTMDGDLQTLQAQLEAKERAEQEAQRKAAAEEEEARLAAIEREKQQQREEEEEERRRKAVAQSAEPSSKTRGKCFTAPRPLSDFWKAHSGSVHAAQACAD